jgi:hypothetical protein
MSICLRKVRLSTRSDDFGARLVMKLPADEELATPRERGGTIPVVSQIEVLERSSLVQRTLAPYRWSEFWATG